MKPMFPQPMQASPFPTISVPQRRHVHVFKNALHFLLYLNSNVAGMIAWQNS